LRSLADTPANTRTMGLQTDETDMKTTAILAAAAAAILLSTAAHAADRASPAEAEAMVKKAVAFIKANGTAKGYAEISNKQGQFKDRDLYIVVYDMKGNCLAHGANAALIGQDLSEATDVDGKPYVKERVELASTKASFWQDYKFANPVSKKIEPKQTYCERLDDTAVCGGIYKP
jgi:signal transduction histidine kinase